MNNGWLRVVGSGHQVTAQLTPEARNCIREAEKVFYATDVVTGTWLRDFHPNTESLMDCYAAGKNRRDTYEQMVERILSPVRDNHKICALLYGHPGVFAYPGHEAIRRARKEGFRAEMLPGISAEDCLWADLEIDPALGWQSFDATHFLTSRPRPDTSIGLILWQIGLIGVRGYFRAPEVWNPAGVRALSKILGKLYSPNHRVIVYSSASYPGFKCHVQCVPLARLAQAHITTESMLYVPPLGSQVPAAQLKSTKGATAKAGSGAMTIVGLGYRVSCQVTPEAVHCIRQADQLFLLAYDPALEAWLKRIKPSAISLTKLLKHLGNWDAVVDRMVSAVTEGRQVCAAFSGHPAVCLTPSHVTASRLRSLGYPVRWIPGISAMDCLYADVGIDPGEHGCQVFEARELLYHKRNPDDRIPLIVLQCSLVPSFSAFKRVLGKCYPRDHRVTLYEASEFAICNPLIRRLPLSSLSRHDLSFSSTLLIPPSSAPRLDREMLSRLGLEN